MTSQSNLTVEQLQSILLQLLDDCNDLVELKINLAIVALGATGQPVTATLLLQQDSLVQALKLENGTVDPSELLQTAIGHAVASGLLLQTRNGAGIPQLTISEAVTVSTRSRRQFDDELSQFERVVQHDRQNAFELYEQHIGLITPVIADKIIQALQTHSEPAVEEAIIEAVSNNRRHWRYIEVILENRVVEDQNHETHQRNHEENLDSQKYLHGKYASLFRKR